MSQVEDRLRSALATAPTPATTIADPMTDLERRIGRARVRLGAFAIVVVAALVAAIVVPLSLIGGGKSDVPAHPPLTPLPASSNVTSFTSGGGYIWTVVFSPTKRTDRYLLQRRDPATGVVTRTLRATTPEEFVAFGAGRVWTYGGGDGAYPHGKVDTHLPSGAFSGHVILGFAGTHGVGLQAGGPHTLAFASDRAFGVENGGIIVSFSRDDLRTGLVAGPTIPGIRQVFVVGSQLVAAGPNGVVRQYDWRVGLTPSQPPLPTTVHGVPIANAPNGLWASVGTSLVREDINGEQFVAMPTPGDPVDAVSSPGGGVYVSYHRDSARPTGKSELAYYSAAALASSQPRPTATIAGSFDTLVLDPAGGVLAGNEGSGIGRVASWDPSE